MYQRVAIFIGALSRNGWAIAQKTCPITTKAKPNLTKHLIKQPRNVIDDPMTTPFLMPFTSITQLEGKFIKM
jgi:hypothetical protein